MTARQGLRWWLLVLADTRVAWTPVLLLVPVWVACVYGLLRMDFALLAVALLLAWALLAWGSLLTLVVRRWLTRRGWRLR